MAVAALLLPQIGLFSLMVADSVKHIVHSAISWLLLRRRLGEMGGQRLAKTVIRTGAAAGLMGAALLLGEPLLEGWIGTSSLLREVLLVGISGGLSVAIFIAAALLLRLDELRWLFDSLRRRL